MKQYNRIKAKYPDALLLFRVGDFYETFGQDAVTASQILNITLTKRANGSASEVELAGFPHHAVDTYLPKLVKAGKRVAICDQLEDPKQTKTIVKRGVTEIVTPGVTLNDNVLDQKSNNFLMSIYKGKKQYGAALIDISTGEFLTTEGSSEKVENVLATYQPKEVIAPRVQPLDELDIQNGVHKMEDWAFQYDYALEKWTKHFGTNSLKGFGLEAAQEAVIAMGAIYAYLVEGTQHQKLGHITEVKNLNNADFVYMDGFSIRNLELVDSQHTDGTSLLQIIDKTLTPMGGRLLLRWLLQPLNVLKPILRRQKIVTHLLNHPSLADQIKGLLEEISDIERLVAKISTERINPKELGAMRHSLLKINDLYQLIQTDTDFSSYFGALPSLDAVYSLLHQRLAEELPSQLSKGEVIKEGVSEELDELRKLQHNAKDYLEALLERELEKTGINSLKLGQNNVFGYYFEVRNTHKEKVPEEWHRKQTLVNAERYITEELKQYEEKIQNASAQIAVLEHQLYQDIISDMQSFVVDIQRNAQRIAEIDVLQGFSQLAEEYQYVMPNLNESKNITLKAARHPVIERLLPFGESYIPNDVYLNPDSQQILMITGPNMSGKSALLRQTALIVILAQMGSYIPATSAEIGLTDKIFTRVGASDNISKGESTFMVEMNETASILNNISENSLILLDEIGRGTSTYDGVSIAWAITEYLHQSPLAPKTLFATHYHELNEMRKTFKKIKNFNVAIKEIEGKIHFVRTLQPGGSEHSFGIHVAELAGMPKALTRRAKEILALLEQSRDSSTLSETTKQLTQEGMQLSFFQLDDPVLENIREELLNLDINTLTPVEALMKLNQIKNLLGR